MPRLRPTHNPRCAPRLNKLTRETKSSGGPTADVILSVRALRHLLSKKAGTDHGAKTLKMAFLEAVNKHLNQIESNTIFIDTSLDPRYKDLYFDDHFK